MTYVTDAQRAQVILELLQNDNPEPFTSGHAYLLGNRVELTFPDGTGYMTLADIREILEAASESLGPPHSPAVSYYR